MNTSNPSTGIPNTGNAPTESQRPVTLLLAALGGEGGGVLTSWVVNAAREAGLPVQATSIPGVAQRTGATTYYIEIWPEAWSELNGRAPVFALSAMPGEVDLMVASELVEAVRAITLGYVTPDRTFLLAGANRAYTNLEKMAPGDGRYDTKPLHQAAQARSKELVVLPIQELARDAETSPNAILLGAIAGCGLLPLTEQQLRGGIEAEAKAVLDNLRGFEAGLIALRSKVGTEDGASGMKESTPPAVGKAPGKALAALQQTARRDFPVELHPILDSALQRLWEYQDAAYGALYLKRLAALGGLGLPAPQKGSGGAPMEVLMPTAKHLALRMSYEDVFRVAQVKIQPERLAQVRAGAGAAAGEPVIVTDYLKPGLTELCDVMPPWIARLLLALAARWPWLANKRWEVHMRSTGISGFLRFRLLAGLRRWRRWTWRFGQETASITRWLEQIKAAAALNPGLAAEIAQSAGLIMGYGDTHDRSATRFARIQSTLVQPALEGRMEPRRAAEAIARVRAAALASASDDQLEATLREVGAEL